MLNFPKNQTSPKNQAERKVLDKIEKERRDLFQAKILQDMKEDFEVPVITPITTTIFPISQKFSDYSNLSYGKVSTVAEAGCGPLNVEYAFRLMGFSIDFEEILKECVEKGYRAYIYNEDDEIIDGAGTEYALFTNLANELQGVSQIITFLKKGCPITVLINNAIYHNDKNRKGNHFITLIGIDKWGNAILMDGNLIKNDISAALVNKPFKDTLFGLRGAWAWEKEKVKKCLY